MVVVCGVDPIQDQESQYLKPLKVALTEPLPAADVSPEAREMADKNGWKLILANSATCHFTALAEPLAISDKPVTFHCDGSIYSQPHVILGDLQPGEVWKADVSGVSMESDGPVATDFQTVAITTIWR